MKLRSKEPYWLLRNGIIQSYPSLNKDISCDILIVGGGITGALMAYQFASEGYKTIVIDKRDIGFGSTCATTSMIQYEIDTPLYQLIDLVGDQAAKDSYTGGTKAIERLAQIVTVLRADCEFKRTTSLHLANQVKHVPALRKEYECRKKIGIDITWLSKEEIANLYGCAGEGGILSQCSASIDPYRLTHALLDFGIRHYDLKVFDHTTLEKVEYEQAKNRAIVDESIIVTCDKIVYSTGYETSELINDDIGKLLSTYACISEPIESLPESVKNTLFWDTQNPYFYCRTTSDNRILIGGEDEDFVNPEKRDNLIPQKESDLVENFNRLMPGVTFVPDFSWAGTFCATKDSLPYMGAHPQYRNSYFMLGFGGNGITFSLMGMEVLSDAIAGRSNRFLKHFRFDR